ncbi:MAG TPA: hypothetical protein VH186_23745 [Chloroflexia bacterium]|nr:hypothetical protein [Chloroflexia bacterium]
MSSSFNIRKVQQEIKRNTSHIRNDPRTNAELEEREHLHELYLRLIPAVYEYSNVSIEELLRGVSLRLTAAEAQYLSDRLNRVRRKRDVVVVSREDEDVLLPLLPDFDPRKVPLAAAWTDGGYYTAKERRNSNGARLRKLGLRDEIAGYVSYRLLILNPPVGRPAWQYEPQEITVSSSYEAEAMAAEIALQNLIERLETERNLPATDQFHVVLFSDCQSLIAALKKGPPPEGKGPEAAATTMARLRALTGLFAGVYPHWEPRRRIKQRLGH